MKRLFCGIVMVFAVILLPARPSYAQGDPLFTEALDVIFSDLETLRAHSAAKSAELHQLDLTKVTMTADKKKLDLLEEAIRTGSTLNIAVTNSRNEMHAAKTKAAAPGATQEDEDDLAAKEAAFVAATNALNTAKTEAELKRKEFEEVYGVEPEDYEVKLNDFVVQILAGIKAREAIDAQIGPMQDKVSKVNILVGVAQLESIKRQEIAEERQINLLEQILLGQKEAQQANTDGLTTLGSKVDDVNAAVSAQTQVQRELAERLITEIVTLRNRVDAGTSISAQSLQSLDSILAKVDGRLEQHAQDAQKLNEIVLLLTQVLERLKVMTAPPAPVVVPAPVYSAPPPAICAPRW